MRASSTSNVQQPFCHDTKNTAQFHQTRSIAATHGVAVAAAVSDPILSARNSFGFCFGHTNFEDYSGDVDKNLFDGEKTLALSGSVGTGAEGFLSSRVGAQLTWT